MFFGPGGEGGGKSGKIAETVSLTFCGRDDYQSFVKRRKVRTIITWMTWLRYSFIFDITLSVYSPLGVANHWWMFYDFNVGIFLTGLNKVGTKCGDTMTLPT